MPTHPESAPKAPAPPKPVLTYAVLKARLANYAALKQAAAATKMKKG